MATPKIHPGKRTTQSDALHQLDLLDQMLQLRQLLIQHPMDSHNRYRTEQQMRLWLSDWAESKRIMRLLAREDTDATEIIA